MKMDCMHPLLRLVALLLILFLAGCVTVGPDYVRPVTAVSATWHTRLPDGLSAGETDSPSMAAWWTAFNDAELSGLIARAVSNNFDLKKARSRMVEERARRGAAKTDFFPTLDATGSATWSRTDGETGTDDTNSLYATGFDARWEVDLFGGVRRSVEAAQADLDAARENLRDVLASLLAEVALNYIEVRTYQIRISTVETTLETQNETCRLTVWQHESGLVDELVVQQARYNYEITRSQLPDLRTGLEEALNRIAVLLGEQPGSVHEALKKQEPIPTPSLKTVIGVPADVLRQRPDVRRAERELAAQTARIGVAVADLYPKLSLSGSIGLETVSAGNLFSFGNGNSNAGLQITWPIFNAGVVSRNIEIQSALQEQALIQYKTTVLNALEEVENSLTTYAEEQQKEHSLREAIQAAREVLEMTRQKYEIGLEDFSKVLDAQRSLLSCQDQLTQSDGTKASNVVRLYKAMGGGWTSLMPDKKQSDPDKERQ